MSDQFLGEIRIFSSDSAIPPGWMRCDGQFLRIQLYQALFDLIGFTYGGDGFVYFAVPRLNGGVPIHQGDGHVVGDEGGTSAVILWPAMMPAHTHDLMASTLPGNTPVPTDHVLASPLNPIYGAANNLTNLNSDSISSAGGGEAHENRQPYLVLSFYIAISGMVW